MSVVLRYAARLDWPHPVTPDEQRRSRWTFKASHADTMSKLRYELGLIGADQALVEAAVDPDRVLRDGSGFWAHAVPQHPGISLTVRAETGVRVFATDVCETWQHNLRSITLGLESLRAVSRYGITPRGEQYAGFLAIESGRPAVMSTEDAARFLIESAGLTRQLDGKDIGAVLESPEMRRGLYRKAASYLHPDRGGDAAAFARLTEAMTLLTGIAQ
ncbi:hypothetical protein [Blastococcus sp. CT_GayMR16]|uniref:hypothetical protein n=1 Tax=Blastococcus sp. CT_GayMR16 TaxID=2559607 RepID=UPI0010739B6A|nr:hypothetical protein [Blastococcus sp. CT_GayMR16]TFV91379.1 hypothetical protein E4P38_01980 [Blastococcus sp. CT_GayMR16]